MCDSSRDVAKTRTCKTCKKQFTTKWDHGECHRCRYVKTKARRLEKEATERAARQQAARDRAAQALY